MNSLRVMLVVARIETQLFVRSWIFRFFTVFAVLFLGAANTYLFIPILIPGIGTSIWMMRSIPSSVPYFNVIVLTVLDCLILIFGVVDSLRRDFSYDTKESMHTRDFTNINYMGGKALGMMLPLVVLNAIILALVCAVNGVFMDDVPVVWQAYLLYPLIITLPALVFITGLSLSVMNLMKAASFALMVLLLFVLLPFFRTSGMISRILDYNAVHLPLLYSDFVGFGNAGDILLHRGGYLLLGVGLVALSVRLFNRLPQSWPSRTVANLSAAVFIVAGLAAGVVFVTGISADVRLRERIQALNEDYVNRPRARLTVCQLDVEHRGSRLSATATLTLTNPHDQTLDRIYLTLNPGFRVTSVTTAGTTLDFLRETQILDVGITPLGTGDEIVLTVAYEGTLDNAACHPDIDREERARLNRMFTYVIHKRYGFISPDYLLLTPASQWYPQSGVPFGTVFPTANERDFIDFTLDIVTRDGMTVISQGAVEQTRAGQFSVRPETKLPGLSLAVGTYEKKAIDVDGVEMAVFYKPGHDYFSSSIVTDPETIIEAIERIKLDYENNKGMKYPFPRYQVVEAPVQFHAYERPWSTYMETGQPQMAIVPEKGFFIQYLDIAGMQDGMRSSYERAGIEIDEDAITGNILMTVVYNVFMSDRMQRDRTRMIRTRKPSMFSMSRMLNPGAYGYIPGYTFSSQFYPFLVSFESDRYPVLNTIMEFYRKHGLNINTQIAPSRMSRALLDEEIACMALEHDTFANYLENGADFDTLNLLLMLKANHLFGSLQASAGNADVDTFLNEFIREHAFERISYGEFSGTVEETFGIDMDRMFESWYSDSRLPLFDITDVSLTEIVDGEHVRYQTMFTITNTEPVPGTVWVEIRIQGGGLGIERETRFITLAGNQTKQIGIVTATPPPDMAVNTMISKNLPIMYRQALGEPRQDHTLEPFSGERIIDYSALVPGPGTIIVDNLDSGFEVVSDPPLEEQEFLSYGFGEYPEDFVVCMPPMPPSRWGKGVMDSAYGARKTIHYTKPGNGNGQVCWTAGIPDTGRYDLEFFVPMIEQPRMIIRPGDDPSQRPPMLGYHTLTIHCGSESHDIIFTPADDSPGWQYVSTFDLDPGNVQVMLSNKSNGRCVCADAIRWVKQ